MTLDLAKLSQMASGEVPRGLFVTISGAHLYGFPSPDSDVDLRGCYLAPLEDLIGLHAPADTVERKLDNAGQEVELVSHEVGKYLRLLCRHNCYILEQIFSPLVVSGTEFLEQLRPLARSCITRGCYHHYRGFLIGRIQLIEKEEVVRAKSLLYAYRVVLTGIHLLRTGVVEANLPELNRHYELPFLEDLIARKQNAEGQGLPGLDWAWHLAELVRWEERLDRAHADSKLPDEAPRAQVHRFLVDLRLDAARLH